MDARRTDGLDGRPGRATDGPIRLLLVDDHQFSRTAIALALDCEPDMAVVAQASSMAEARAFLRGHRGVVDIALLDLHLPDGNGLDLICDLKRCCRQARAVVVAGAFDPRDKVHAVEAGALGYLRKGESLETLLDTIRRAARGEPLLSPQETMALLRDVGRERLLERGGIGGVERLTPREQEVLGALAEGLSDKEIACRLVISRKTVHSHVTSILGKLDVHSRSQALIAAVRAGLIQL
jgi:DNA-binding NarL/FixJ family response regulator